MAEKENNEKKEDVKQSSTFQVVVFKLGEEEYGLHIDQIKEVVITPPITRMPQASSYIKGVANVRGNIIAILDLEDKFGLKKTIELEEGKKNYTLVIESEEFKMGVLVKEVPNTLSISTADIEETLLTGDGNLESSYIKGIVKLNKRLIILIDIFKVLTEQEIGQTYKKATISAA